MDFYSVKQAEYVYLNHCGIKLKVYVRHPRTSAVIKLVVAPISYVNCGRREKWSDNCSGKDILCVDHRHFSKKEQRSQQIGLKQFLKLW